MRCKIVRSLVRDIVIAVLQNHVEGLNVSRRCKRDTISNDHDVNRVRADAVRHATW